MKHLLITVLFLATPVWFASCALHESKETFRVLIPPDKPQIALEYTSKVWGGSVLSFFKVRQVSKTGPLSELFIGDMENRPDPNSIEVLSGGIVPLLIKGLTKGK
jgi:hypothetical protein